ncbi:TetR/AcrR family transcriptional regulator [Streptomyces sp. NPDC048825]|uniref:TetR/AcrR family transcriptional regulator n=1 Tax=Streptomyces sp. NPDC048825 TaxID=3365592 RepID=UPI0037249FD2
MASSTPPARGPYAKTAQRRREILQTAVEVFAEYGYHGSSLREIAARVGLSDTGLTHHFGGKRALLSAIIQERDDEDQAAFADAHLTGVPELVRLNAQRPGLVQLFALLSAEATVAKHPAHEFFTERYERLREQVSGYLSGAQREGHIRADRDPDQAAVVLLALLDGLQIQWLYDRDVDMVAAFDAFYETWLAPPSGLTDQPSDTPP